ncbi:unnamed protein product, partial [Tilletia laevis]
MSARRGGWAASAIGIAALSSSAHAFQYAVLATTSCDVLAYSITLESWEYKSATFLRTSLGDPDDPTRFTQVEIDSFFSRSLLVSPFVTKWNKPLTKGGSYSLFFGLLDHKQKPIKLPGSSGFDSVTVDLTIPPCDGSAPPVQPTKTAVSTSSKPPSSSTAAVSSVTVTVTGMATSQSATSKPTASPSTTAATIGPSPPNPNSTAGSSTGSGSGSGSNSNDASSKSSSGVSPLAMAGAIVGAIVVTCFLLWLLALCRRRVVRSVRNHNAQRASYLGPAPRPLLHPTGQSGRYYHTPTPGSSVMRSHQSRTAAFFGIFTGRSRRRRSVIDGIPPVMRQTTSNTLDASMYGGHEQQPRGSTSTVTPILRRPGDGFAPVGTAEQVAARRLSRESAARSLSTQGQNHPSHDSPYLQSRPTSATDQRYGGSSSSSFFGTSPGALGGPILVPLDASDPYGYDASAVTGNLVDTSDYVPAGSDPTLADHQAGGQQHFPRPFLLGAPRPTSRSSSSNQSRNSAVPPQPSSNRPSFQSSHYAGNNNGGNPGTRPTSASSGLSYLQQQQSGGPPSNFVNPHKRNRPRNNDWATPYTPSLSGQTNNMSPGGRSRSSSTASVGGGGGGGGGGGPMGGWPFKSGGFGLGFPNPPLPPPPTNQQYLPTSTSNMTINSFFSSSGPSQRLSSGAGSVGGNGMGGMTGSNSGLIPLQLAGSAQSNLTGSAFPKELEPTAGGASLYTTRGRAGSSSSNSNGSGSVNGGTGRGRTSMSGSIPLLAPMSFEGGGGGGGMYPGPGEGSYGAGSRAGASSPMNMFASPLLTAIVPPVPAASASPNMAGGISFLPGSGSSSPAATSIGLPARGNSVSPDPSAKDTASSSSTSGGGVPGGGPRKRPSFGYSNDPVAYMQATAGFARPPSRANSVSGGNG